jgi:stage V sporulation protein AE
MRQKRRVILITDGDKYAQEAVEAAGRALGCTIISRSAGNPTPLTGPEIVEEIRKASHDPVLVMFDDCGFNGVGQGEEALQFVAKHPEIEPLGAIAVASNSYSQEWTHVDVSVDRFGNLTAYGVDKEGLPDIEYARIVGDTVYSLDQLDLPLIVGIGDIGKLHGVDEAKNGAPITKQAIELILERSGSHR